jgi:hypothetical protein
MQTDESPGLEKSQAVDGALVRNDRAFAGWLTSVYLA